MRHGSEERDPQVTGLRKARRDRGLRSQLAPVQPLLSAVHESLQLEWRLPPRQPERAAAPDLSPFRLFMRWQVADATLRRRQGDPGAALDRAGTPKMRRYSACARP